MDYELDDLDLSILAKCHSAVEKGDTSGLDEDDLRDAVELLVKTTPLPIQRTWPYRLNWHNKLGYVVWRDVFEGEMKCSLEQAVEAHRHAVFVSEAEAEAYCEWRNKFSD